MLEVGDLREWPDDSSFSSNRVERARVKEGICLRMNRESAMSEGAIDAIRLKREGGKYMARSLTKKRNRGRVTSVELSSEGVDGGEAAK